MQTPLSSRDWLTADFDFELPAALIAQAPAEPRDAARLLHVTPSTLVDRHIYDLPEMLRAGDVLVLNNTKVIPARLYGKREAIDIEILLSRKTGPEMWRVYARPGKRLHAGDRIDFAPGFAAEVLEKCENGEVVLKFLVPDEALRGLLELHGEPPLPPYIRRENGSARADAAAYQTIFAAHEGAIAAPTAGLHFTPELLRRLEERGVDCATITLHVGAGTFMPVKAERLKDHVMHAEWAELTPGIASYLNKMREMKRRIVAVGTTSLRLLETSVDTEGRFHPFRGETDIFITPGHVFRSAEALLTNFHLPQSTLFMLVAAFAGLPRMREAYAHAIRENYRFYSYGDATFLEKA